MIDAAMAQMHRSAATGLVGCSLTFGVAARRRPVVVGTAGGAGGGGGSGGGGGGGGGGGEAPGGGSFVGGTRRYTHQGAGTMPSVPMTSAT